MPESAVKFAPSFWHSCASCLCPASAARGSQIRGIFHASGKQEGAALVALWLVAAGEIMGHAAE